MSTVEEALGALELAHEAHAVFDIDTAIAQYSAAIRGLTAAGEKRPAAMACAALGDLFANGLGNTTAARAWFARATATLADEPDCVEQGWVAVAAMGCDVGDPVELLAGAELALDRARRFGDVNLEAKALADGGLAHVQAGRIAEGMAMLDEAMALVCGPADDLDTAGKSACSLFTACYYSVDFDRAASWADLLRARGLLGPEAGAPVFLSSHCDTVQACLLCELGRWSEAETLLERSAENFEQTMGQDGFHPTILLADLRIRQGRLGEAEALLLDLAQTFEGLLPTARLHLAQGDADLAAATARRGLRALGTDHLRAVELLAVLADAETVRGDHDAAAAACTMLAERVDAVGSPILTARSVPARVRHLAAVGDTPMALALIESTLDSLDRARSPLQRVHLLVESARLRDAAGDRAGATVDARAASATLDGLDVVLPEADRSLLDRLLDRTGPGPRPPATLRRDGKGWVVAHDGREARLRDSKGLRHLAELLAAPGVERHALDLVDRIEGVGDVDRRHLGDAGDLLDATARDAYRRRLEALRADIDDAIGGGRLDEAETMQAEHDALVGQLAEAFGLGGRPRRASSAAERARLNVTRALRSAIRQIDEALPAAGASLDRSIRTGGFCVFAPATGEIEWIVHSGMNETTGS